MINDLPAEAAIVQAALQATAVAHLTQRAIASLSGGERAAQVWEPFADGAPQLLIAAAVPHMPGKDHNL